jgi:hypothetical protein
MNESCKHKFMAETLLKKEDKTVKLTIIIKKELYAKYFTSSSNAYGYNLYFYSAIVANSIASAVANSTCSTGHNLSLNLLIGCCLGRLSGAADSYLWGFGQNMGKEVTLRAELSIGICGCCGYHRGGCGIRVGCGILPVFWRRELGKQSVGAYVSWCWLPKRVQI